MLCDYSDGDIVRGITDDVFPSSTKATTPAYNMKLVFGQDTVLLGFVCVYIYNLSYAGVVIGSIRRYIRDIVLRQLSMIEGWWNLFSIEGRPTEPLERQAFARKTSTRRVFGLLAGYIANHLASIENRMEVVTTCRPSFRSDMLALYVVRGDIPYPRR